MRFAGGSGSVFFFGYRYPHSNLDLEDFRSRDHFWDLQRYAHEFFTRDLPFHEMRNANELTPAPDDFVFAKPGEIYAVYLPDGGTTDLDLSGVTGVFDVRWCDPRYGGGLQIGSVRQVHGGGMVALGNPPRNPGDDWAVHVRPAREVVGPPVLDGPTRFQAKLGTDLAAGKSRPGDAVTAVVFSPERFLRTEMTGAVDEAADGRIRFSFRNMEHRGKTFSIESSATDFVNSKGHRLVDEQGARRPYECSAVNCRGC